MTKQDETPGRFASGPSGDFDYPFSITENDGLVFALVNDGARAAQIVKSLNAYTSTDALRSALALVLPMAKGYAHAHPVGDNYGKCVAAEEALSGNAVKDTP